LSYGRLANHTDLTSTSGFLEQYRIDPAQAEIQRLLPEERN